MRLQIVFNAGCFQTKTIFDQFVMVPSIQRHHQATSSFTSSLPSPNSSGGSFKSVRRPGLLLPGLVAVKVDVRR
jgi:hypothetical protein